MKYVRIQHDHDRIHVGDLVAFECVNMLSTDVEWVGITYVDQPMYPLQPMQSLETLVRAVPRNRTERGEVSGTGLRSFREPLTTRPADVYWSIDG
jgi:hypothetical protein